MRPQPQTIRSPSGEELVVLPRADYDALVARADADTAADEAAEDAADVALFDEAMAEMAADREAGRDPVLPKLVTNAMLQGATRLGAWRKHRCIGQQALAKTAGISQSYLSQLESGARAGSPETLAALAEALDVPVDHLS